MLQFPSGPAGLWRWSGLATLCAQWKCQLPTVACLVCLSIQLAWVPHPFAKLALQCSTHVLRMKESLVDYIGQAISLQVWQIIYKDYSSKISLHSMSEQKEVHYRNLFSVVEAGSGNPGTFGRDFVVLAHWATFREGSQALLGGKAQ